MSDKRIKGKTSAQIAYEWAKKQAGARESVKYDEDTGRPYLAVTIPLKPNKRKKVRRND